MSSNKLVVEHHFVLLLLLHLSFSTLLLLLINEIHPCDQQLGYDYIYTVNIFYIFEVTLLC